MGRPKMHRHNWKLDIIDRVESQLEYVCSCGARKSRTISDEEQERYDKLQNILIQDRLGLVHQWVAIMEKLEYDAWEILRAGEKFAADHPDMTQLIPCDDSHFMSSVILCIHCGTGDNYGWTECYFLRQFERPDNRTHFILRTGKQLRNVANRIDTGREVPTNYEGAVEHFWRKYKRQPNAHDAFNWNKAKNKRWWKEHVIE